MTRRTSYHLLGYRSVFVILACAITVAVGQQQPVAPIQLQQPAQLLIDNISNNETESNVIFVEPTAPIINLFDRAEEGIARRDWKFAIDSLQRIIDDPEASLLPRDGQTTGEAVLYESARIKAIHLIAQLPPEGLRAYRLLYDGKAKGYYERAQADHDADLLRSAVNRFLLTRYGDDAADLLASWALDEGRVTEAISIIRNVLEMVPDYDVPRSWFISKLAVAYTMAGMTSSANKLLEEDVALAQDNQQPPTWYTLLTDASLFQNEVNTNDVNENNEWPVYGGTLQRSGRMPAVSPTLIDETPWSYQLPESNSYSWRQTLQMEDHESDTLPTIYAVADQQHIFIRKPYGVVALDPDELRVLWEVPPMPEHPSIVVGNTASGAMDFVNWSSGVAFSDHVIGSVAVAGNLLFTVEPNGRGEIPGVDTSTVPRARRNAPFRPGHTRDTATRLVAYDKHTGERRWHRGRTFDPNDAFGDVEFRSLPLMVHDRLWVTYLDRADLYFGVLDPKDGSVTHRILLGSHRSIATDYGPMLSPAYHEGIFYIPTNLGLLFAVDARNFEVRWASQYRLHSTNKHTIQIRRRTTRPTKPAMDAFYKHAWMASPPIISQDKVLLAAMDTDELQAFSAVDGDLLWTADSDGRYYMVAADQKFIWLGGRGVTALSLQDGSIVWEYDLDTIPTGKAVLSGSTIHIPCSDGLITLDATSGKSIHQENLSGDQPPLGNLLCFRSGLYSLDPAGIRLYPDVDRIYTTARTAVQTDSDNVSTILRLAWMQYLRDEPDKAYITLNQVTDSMTNHNPRWAESLSRIQVASLQKMADKSSDQPEEALSLLEKAQQLARRPEDQLSITRALAKQYQQSGDLIKAYETLYEIGMQQDASMLVYREDRVQVGLRVDLAAQMREIDRILSPTQREQLTKKFRKQLEEACHELEVSARVGIARKKLTVMSDLDVVGGVGSLALLSMADWEITHLRYERAEQLLQDSKRWSTDPEISIATLIKLFELYAMDRVGMIQSARQILDQLDTRFAKNPLPFALFRSMGWNESLRIDQGVVEDWTSLMHESLQMKIDAEVSNPRFDPLISLDEAPVPAWIQTPPSQAIPEGEIPFTSTGDLQRSLAFNDLPRLVHFADDAKEVMGGKIIFRSRGDVLYCQQAATGELLWQTTMQLSQSFEPIFNARTRNQFNNLRRAETDGQIGLFNGREGLFAVGLHTGRRLWVKPYDVPSEFGMEPLRDPLMAVSHGYLAAIPRTGRLSMIRLRDGFSLWERDLRGERVASIMMTPEIIITTDSARQRVHLFNRSDGKMIDRVHFTQPGMDDAIVQLIETQGVLCGPDENEQTNLIKGIDLATGKTLWQIDVDKPVVQMFKPQDGYVGIGLMGGDVRIVRARSGEILLDHRVSSVISVVDGEMLDATFIVKCVVNNKNINRYQLIAIDIPTGEELWRRRDVIDTMSNESSSMLSGRTLPAIIEYLDPADSRSVRMGLIMMNTRNGETLGGIADLDFARSGVQFSGDFAIKSGAVIVCTTSAIKTFPAKVVREETGSGF